MAAPLMFGNRVVSLARYFIKGVLLHGRFFRQDRVLGAFRKGICGGESKIRQDNILKKWQNMGQLN
ncbi:hypothetical protein [Thiomicrospira sp. S5]|uniref:hypothetical protein n=1 Tax=Thiomicrospira sp. S5 TaxID=1803865 RepID=UPI0004A7315E|nr:hypothetical protein [Thiomicrospira sp. S5]AZR81172.1 hypothetical protein AYJ59_01965 [Thiomicrospira sp. S5]